MNSIRIFVLSLFIALSGCINEPITDNEVQYYNSFESRQDTIGWLGLSEHMFKNEPSPNGGNKSLYVGGGCVQPAASLEIKNLPSGSYNISFWAKIEDQNQSGTITISNSTHSELFTKTITQTEWEKYETGPISISGNSP